MREACFALWVSAAMRGAMRGVAQGRVPCFWHPSPHPPNCYPAEGKSGGRWMKKGKVGEWFIAPRHLKVEAPLAPPWSLEPTITLIPNPANSNSLLTIPGYTYYKELPTEITLTRFFVVWHPFSSGIFYHFISYNYTFFVVQVFLIVLLSSCTLKHDRFYWWR